MAIRYTPLELDQPGLFGIGLSGTVSRSDKQNLLALADKCLGRGKLHLILDMTELSAIGGGGARVLADFQLSLTSRSGEAVFVGAGKVVRRFLRQKFDDLPLRFFPSLEVAQERFCDSDYAWDPDEHDPASGGACDDVEVVPVAGGAEVDPDQVGAFSAFDDQEFDIDPAPAEPEPPARAPARASARKPEPAASVRRDAAPAKPAAAAGREAAPTKRTGRGAARPVKDEGRDAVQDVLEEFNGSEDEAIISPAGRRKDHRYTSLAEAAEELGRWQPGRRDAAFAAALRNLLFSHGLAEDSLLLTRHDDLLSDDQEQWALPAEGSLATQLFEAQGPLTMLDIQDQDLMSSESALLEHLTPDLLLPVRRGDRLVAAVLLVRGEGEQEYTVAEHFALELLMRLLAGALADTAKTDADARQPAAAPAASAVKAEPPLTPAASEFSPAGRAWTASAQNGEAMSDALLQLALTLPEAHDGPHFWRLLARHVWPVLPLRSLGYLAPGLHRAQVVAGSADHWQGIDLGEEKLRHFLRVMELPVKVANLPTFFRQTKEQLQVAGVDWIVGLNWQEKFLGTALLGLDEAFVCDDPSALLSEIFAETSRLLHRSGTSHQAADVDLEIVRLLIEQREKRCQGDYALTGLIVGHLERLSRAMGFAPDQERDLIYGCLLRDIGLVAKEDALMGPRPEMDPTQWPRFRQHPTEGAALLRNLHVPQTILDVVLAHHERFNGKGFPVGLKGRQIPLAARIVKVVESWVSLVTGDEGRPPISVDKAIASLRDDQGERFDPDIVAVFIKALQPELQGVGIGGRLAD